MSLCLGTETLRETCCSLIHEVSLSVFWQELLWFLPRLQRIDFSPSFLQHNWVDYIQHSYTLESSEWLSHSFCQCFSGLIWVGKKQVCQCQKHFQNSPCKASDWILKIGLKSLNLQRFHKVNWRIKHFCSFKCIHSTMGLSVACIWSSLKGSYAICSINTLICCNNLALKDLYKR